MLDDSAGIAGSGYQRWERLFCCGVLLTRNRPVRGVPGQQPGSGAAQDRLPGGRGEREPAVEDQRGDGRRAVSAIERYHDDAVLQ